MGYEIGDIVLYRINKDTYRHYLILDVIARNSFYDNYTALHLEDGVINYNTVFYMMDKPYMVKVA